METGYVVMGLPVKAWTTCTSPWTQSSLVFKIRLMSRFLPAAITYADEGEKPQKSNDKCL